MKDKIVILKSNPVAIAEDDTCKYATFLISVLDEYDRRGRMITHEKGEQFHETLRGCPIVAKLIRDRANRPVDYGGHEVRTWKKRNGEIETTYNTYPIGAVVDTWIEDREVEGYEGTKSCIMAKAKLWTSRYPEYFTVFDKLWSEGRISSSWELRVTDVEEQPSGNLILKAFAFIGNALLGTNVIPAVKGAGVYEYAEDEEQECDSTEELEEALLKDINNNNSEQEEKPLEIKEENLKEDVPEEAEVEVKAEPESPEKKKSVEEPEVPNPEEPSEPKKEEEKKTAEGSEVPEEPEDLAKRVDDLSTALIQANELIQALKADIESLTPFKAQMEQMEQERLAAEKEEKVAALKKMALDSKQFTEQEFDAESESGNKELIAMLANVDEAGITKLIAQRLIASLGGAKKTSVITASVITHKPDLNKMDAAAFTGENIVSAYINRRKEGR